MSCLGKSERSQPFSRGEAGLARNTSQGEAGFFALPLRLRQLWPLKASHDTVGFQFVNVPFGLSFQAHTCSV